MHGTAELNGLLHEPYQAVCRRFRNPFHADPADTRAVFLSRDHDQRLTLGLSAPDALLQAAQIGFIHFHPSRQPITARPDHRSSELVQPRPGRLVAAQSQDPWQAQGPGSVLLSRQPIHSPEPIHQRLPRILEDRARRHRRLEATLLALHQRRSHRPKVTAAAARAAKALRPSKPEQIFSARLLGIKPRFELAQIPRVFLHGLPYYSLGSPESSKYPPFKIMTIALGARLSIMMFLNYLIW